jgi:hypothetical protein
VLPTLRTKYREALLSFQNAIMMSTQEAVEKVESLIAEAKAAIGNEKRRFAIEYVKSPRCANFESNVWFN